MVAFTSQIVCLFSQQHGVCNNGAVPVVQSVITNVSGRGYDG